MSATYEEARYVFEEWHRCLVERDAAVARLYTDDAELESPLVQRLLDVEDGVARGRAAIDQFTRKALERRPGAVDLPALYRTGTFAFDGQTLIWEYPRATPNGDQLDLVEVMELEGPRIRSHRIYWGWFGTERLVDNALARRPAS